MKERILSGWTFTRTFYVIAGTFIIIQSVMQQQWFGVLLGGYFASMGLFAFGCAAGNCFGNNCRVPARQHQNEEIQKTNFEEVK